MLTDMKNSEKIKNRLVECVENGDLTFGDCIHIIEYLANKVNLVTQAQYSKKHEISRAGTYKRVASNKEATLLIGGVTFIID